LVLTVRRLSRGARAALLGAALGSLCLPARAVDILEFSTNDPEKWEEVRREPSQAAPLTLEDVRRLVPKVKEKKLIKIIRDRKVLMRPTGQALAELKEKGASDAVLAALSAHALAENRKIDLLLTLDLENPAGGGEGPYLYLALVHKGKGVQEDLITSSLSRLQAEKWQSDEIVDASDPLLPNKVRRIRIRGPVRAVHHGPMELRVLLSRRPQLLDLTDTERLTPEEKRNLQTMEFDYPEASLASACALDLVVGRDRLAGHAFSLKHKRLRCFWD
jgi:hypothetical protein